MKLYELATQYQRALVALEDTDLPDEVVADTIEGLTGDIEVKGQNVAAFFQNLQADVGAMKEAEQRIYQRRKTYENRIESLKYYLKSNMERAGITKIECPEFCVSVQNNPASVDVFDSEEIPKEYTKEKVTVSIDKTAIKNAIKDDIDVPGAKLSHSTRLVVK